MILATPYGNRELRAFEGSDFIPPHDVDVSSSGTGRRRRELAVAAVACAVRLVSDTIGGFTMRTYEGHGANRKPVMGARTSRLYQDPAEDVSSFELWSDLTTSIELEKFGFVWKVKGDRQVDELVPMDPGHFRVKRAKPTAPAQVFARVNGETRDVTADVIMVRGWAAVPGVEGVSTLDLHKDLFRGARSFDEYRGHYFDNDATPGVVLEAPGRLDKAQRRDLLSAWVRRHSGAANQRRPGLVWGGVKVHTITSSLKDAQAAELMDAIARDVARAFRIYPVELMHAALAGGRGIQTAELWSDLMLRFTLWGRMRRIERAFAQDRDLYSDWTRYPRFDVSDWHRGDIKTIAETAHQLVQVGVETPNEARAQIGLEPHKDGDILNWPPVGATSPAKGGGGTKDPAEPDADDEDDPPADTGADPQED